MKNDLHIPVLLNEAIAGLNIKSDGIYVDMTLGRAGHSSEILKKLNNEGCLICFDQDLEAIAYSKQKLSSISSNYQIINDNFRNIEKDLDQINISKVDGVLFDLGVSSPQFDEDYRGFSYRYDAPLDMRMNQNSSLTAKYIVNEYSFEELLRVFKEYGEDKYSYNIAKNICKRREIKPIETTLELVEIIKASKPKKELDKVAKDFRTIYNKAWAKFNGVPEMTEEQVRHLLSKMKPIIDERLIYFAYYRGEPIGFFIMVPDLNGAIRHLNGKFGWWAKLKFLYHLKIRKSCNIIEGLTFAVAPEFQGKGVESGMIDCFKLEINSRPTHYKHLELAWIGDFNPLMIRVVETYVGARKYKTHVTYRYLFDREKEFKRAPKVSFSRHSN